MKDKYRILEVTDINGSIKFYPQQLERFLFWTWYNNFHYVGWGNDMYTTEFYSLKQATEFIERAKAAGSIVHKV